MKIWLSKPPMERLKQMMEDNAALMRFWTEARKVNKDAEQNPIVDNDPTGNRKVSHIN